MKSSVVIAVVLVAIFVAVESKPYAPPSPTTHYYHHTNPDVVTRVPANCNNYAYRDRNFCKTHSYGYYFKYDADCTCFIQCDQSRNTFVMPCATGTRWHPTEKTCVHGTDCNEPLPTFPPGPGVNYPRPECVGKGYDSGNFCQQKGYLANKFHYEYPRDCTCFYQCDKFGRTFIMPCAKGTVFNEQKGVCVWPCPKTCGSRPFGYHITINQAYCPTSQYGHGYGYGH